MATSCTTPNAVLLSAFKEHLCCPICKETLCSPYSTSCGHAFCYKCITQHLEARQRCPCCKKYLTVAMLHPVFVLDQVVSTAQNLVSACETSMMKQATMLARTINAVDTEEQIEDMITLLKQRRSELEKSKAGMQLQLLLLFLQNTKTHLVQQQQQAEQQLACMKRDLQETEEWHKQLTIEQDKAAALQATMEPNGASQGLQAHEAAIGPQVDQMISKVTTHFDQLVAHYLRFCDTAEADPESGPSAAPSAPGILAAHRLDARQPLRATTGRTSGSHGDTAMQSLPTDSAATAQSAQAEMGGLDGPCAAQAGGRPPAASLEVASTSAVRMAEFGSVLSDVIQFTELVSVAEILPSEAGRPRPICSLGFSCDGRVLGAAAPGAPIKLYSFDDVLAERSRKHKPVAELDNQIPMSGLAFSPTTAHHLLSHSTESNLTLWDTESRAPIRSFTEVENRIRSIAHLPKQPGMFVSGSDDCRLRLWNAQQAASVLQIEHTSPLCCVAASAWDKHLVAAGTAARALHVYDIRHTNTPLALFPDQQKPLSYVRFIQRNEIVGSRVDSSMCLWDLTALDAVRTFTGHVNNRRFVGMDVNGPYIVTGSENGKVHLYCKHLPRPLLNHTLKPSHITALASAPEAQVTYAAAWKPKSTHVVVSTWAGSAHVLAMRDATSRGST